MFSVCTERESQAKFVSALVHPRILIFMPTSSHDRLYVCIFFFFNGVGLEGTSQSYTLTAFSKLNVIQGDFCMCDVIYIWFMT